VVADADAIVQEGARNPARAVRTDVIGTAAQRQAAQASPRMINVALPAVAKV
jgi:hypothetical protein